MLNNERWLLPEGIEELLPTQAAQLESMRRRLLDLFDSWGYELVIPPFIEYLESLLTGTGNDLDLRTFKLTDQLTGRLMGVRADMTPQVARIDAHRLGREAPTRLCYMGTVLHTRPLVHGGSRSPMQTGAELYGHPGPESDVEVLRLMVETLRTVGLGELHIDLGHVGIFRGLAAAAGVDGEREARLFDALQRKAQSEIDELLADPSLNPAQVERLARLSTLNGGHEVLDEAAALLDGAGAPVEHALRNLRRVAELAGDLEHVRWHFDLAELRGYHYHTGVVFSAFVPGRGQAVAVGGRYDDIGKVFGRARPATGFSADLMSVLALVPAEEPASRGIFAPSDGDPVLAAAVRELRAAGERVVPALPGQHGGPGEAGCDRELVREGDGWQVVPVGR